MTELDDDSEVVVKVGLNTWGPDYGDTWTKYKDAVIWASSVTFALMVVMITAFIYFIKNEEPEKEEDEKKENDEVADKHVYVNKSYDVIDDKLAEAEVETSVL